MFDMLKYRGFVVLFALLFHNLAMAGGPFVFDHQLIEAATGRNYVGVAVGDADIDISGNEVYVVSITDSNSSDLAEFYRVPDAGWTGVGIERRSQLDGNYEAFRSVAVGHADPTKTGNEVYTAKDNAVSWFYKPTGGSWTGPGAMNGDVERCGPGTRVYRKVVIADGDPCKSGNELYIISDTGGLAEFYRGPTSWIGIGIDTTSTFTGVAVGNIVNDVVMPGYGTKQLLYSTSTSAFGYFAYNFAQSRWVFSGQIEYAPGRAYLGVAIAEVDSGYPGNEALYISRESSTWASDISYYNAYWGAGAAVGFGLERTMDGRTNSAIAVGDLLGDGKTEIVLAAKGNDFGEETILEILYFDDASMTWKSQVLDHSDRDYYDVALGDVDGNGTLDIVYGAEDHLGVYLTSACSVTPAGDLNEDCFVDMSDLGIFAEHWLEGL